MLKKIIGVILLVILCINISYAATISRSSVTSSSNTNSSTDIQSPGTTSSIDLTKLDPSAKTLDPSFAMTSIIRLTKEIDALKKENQELKKSNDSLKQSQSKIQEKVDKIEKEVAGAKLAVIGIDKTITAHKKEFDNHVHKLIGNASVTVQNQEAGGPSFLINPPLAKKGDGSTPADITKRKKNLRRVKYTETPVSKEEFEKDVESVN